MTETDVAIIGGGIIGTSVGYYLSRLGKHVTIIERDDVAAGTSSACDGAVTLQSKHPGIHLSLALESAAMYQGLAGELGSEVHYRQRGGMVVMRTREEQKAMESWVDGQRRTGLDVQILDRREARDMQPVLGDGVLGAAYSPADGDVCPFEVAHAYAAAVKRLGGAVLTGTTLKAIEVERARVKAVVTDRGRVKAGAVVNCAGAWGAHVAAMVGIEVPITPRKGHLIVTEKTPPIQKSVMLSAEYVAIKYDPDWIHTSADKFSRQGISLVLEQTAEGNLLIGGNREFSGYDKSADPYTVTEILRNALSWAPVLGRLNVIRVFTGLRPYTPDGLPILGPVPGVKGFYMAAGHEGDGIALAPVTGRLVAECIVHGETSYPIEPFSVRRFQTQSPNT